MKKLADLFEKMGTNDPELRFSKPITFLSDIYAPIMKVSFVNKLNLDIAFPRRDFHTLRNTNLIKLYASVSGIYLAICIAFLGRSSLFSTVCLVPNLIRTVKNFGWKNRPTF